MRRGLSSRISGLGLVLLALISCGLALAWRLADPAAPDAFYLPPPGASADPGALLRSEAFTRAVPKGARAWRILYTTTSAAHSSKAASAIVMTSTVPRQMPRPVIAWAHGTTGVDSGCAPSMRANAFVGVPALDEILAAGWVYIAADPADLVGESAGLALLDAVRAARQTEGLDIDGRTILWGVSEGGNAAMWAGIRARDYAPDIQILGVAALAPLSDVGAFLASEQMSSQGKIVSTYLTAAYERAYPDPKSDSYIDPASHLILGDIASRCAVGFPQLFSATEASLLPRTVFAHWREGAFGARLDESTPKGLIPAPVLIAQGETDNLVPIKIQDRYVATRCAAGQVIEYRLYRSRDHTSLLAQNSRLEPDLVRWTQNRLSGLPAQTTCPQN